MLTHLPTTHKAFLIGGCIIIIAVVLYALIAGDVEQLEHLDF